MEIENHELKLQVQNLQRQLQRQKWKRVIVGRLYVVQTDNRNYYRIGQTGTSIKKRLSTYQSSNALKIQYLFSFESSNPRLLESVVFSMLDEFRVKNPNPSSFVNCDFNHIKKTIEFFGGLLEQYPQFDETESISDILSKTFITELEPSYDDVENNSKLFDNKKEESDLIQWVKKNIRYQEGVVLDQKEVYNRYYKDRFRVGTKEKGRLRQKLEYVFKYFQEYNINFAFGVHFISTQGTTIKGWDDLILF